jgi:hypothetical protein
MASPCKVKRTKVSTFAPSRSPEVDFDADHTVRDAECGHGFPLQQHLIIVHKAIYLEERQADGRGRNEPDTVAPVCRLRNA